MCIVQRVTSELSAVELEASREHVRYLCAFLPENFARQDADAVAVNVLLPRLVGKIQLLQKHLVTRVSARCVFFDQRVPCAGGTVLSS